eukprot:m.7095 g.7095  ORF g.7095 m.7095 type:complete len:286 (-) comp3646_c0_seq1:78-935(-)
MFKGAQPSGQPFIPTVQKAIARIPYDACPLCNSTQFNWLGEASIQHHPLYQPALPPTQAWKACVECGHQVTSGYYDEDALKIIFSKANPAQVPSPDTIESARYISAPIVERITRLGSHGIAKGKWLDVGCGNGALFTTAVEFGYEGEGIDVRQAAVTLLEQLGYKAFCGSFEEYAASAASNSYDVISMADVLEHMPFPRKAIQQANKLLRQNGLLFISLPNRDTLTWKIMDQTGTNPYWGELEHFHNFNRTILVSLLVSEGFKLVHYDVSRRYKACMETVFVKES